MNRHQKFNNRGERRYEIRVKYINGSNALWGYCDDPMSDDTEDLLRRAESEPGVVAARVINPKTGKPFKTPDEMRIEAFRDSFYAND